MRTFSSSGKRLTLDVQPEPFIHVVQINADLNNPVMAKSRLTEEDRETVIRRQCSALGCRLIIGNQFVGPNTALLPYHLTQDPFLSTLHALYTRSPGYHGLYAVRSVD